MKRTQKLLFAAVTFAIALSAVFFHSSGCSRRGEDLGQKISSVLSGDAWVSLFAESGKDLDTMAHQFLICGRDCALPGGGDLFARVFKSGEISLSDLENHRGVVLHLLSEMNVPLGEELHFKEGRFTVAGLIDKSIEGLDIPAGREINFGDEELGWLLCAYAHYLPVNARIINKNGMSTSFPRMMTDIMTNNSFDKFSEAGTHELMGLACGIRKLEKEVPEFSAELAPLLNWSHSFLGVKIGRFLDAMDEDGDFHIPFVAEYGISKRLVEANKLHSVNAGIAGHILTVIAMTKTGQEILSDRRIERAVKALINHMTLMDGEIIPLLDGELRNEAVYQRISYAHGWEALKMIQDKIEGNGAR